MMCHVENPGRLLALCGGLAVLAMLATTADAALFADGFDRPDSPDVGSLWTEQWPDWSIVGGVAQSVNTDCCSLMTVNGFADAQPSVQATVDLTGDPRPHYVALVVLYQDNDRCIFVKLQDGYDGSPPDGLYDTAYFYMGNNSLTPWGDMVAGYDDWVDLAPYFSTATVALTVVGDVAYLAVDRDLDGDFLGLNDSVYGRGDLPLADLGLGIGVGGYDGACVDNFYAMPEPVTMTLVGLGVAACVAAGRKR